MEPKQFGVKTYGYENWERSNNSYDQGAQPSSWSNNSYSGKSNSYRFEESAGRAPREPQMNFNSQPNRGPYSADRFLEKPLENKGTNSNLSQGNSFANKSESASRPKDNNSSSDHPLCQQLSFERKKRFRWLVSHGYNPNEAFRKSKDPMGTHPPKPSTKPKKNKWNEQQSNGSNPAKRPRLMEGGGPNCEREGQHTSAPSSYQRGVKMISIRIVPRNYPDERLGQGQIKSLQDDIMRMMLHSRGIKIQFVGSSWTPGWFQMTCANRETADWVKSITPNLKPWNGAQLRAIEEQEFQQQNMHDFPQQNMHDFPQQNMHDFPQQNMHDFPQHNMHDLPQQNMHTGNSPGRLSCAVQKLNNRYVPSRPEGKWNNSFEENISRNVNTPNYSDFPKNVEEHSSKPFYSPKKGDIVRIEERSGSFYSNQYASSMPVTSNSVSSLQSSEVSKKDLQIAVMGDKFGASITTEEAELFRKLLIVELERISLQPISRRPQLRFRSPGRFVSGWLLITCQDVFTRDWVLNWMIPNYQSFSVVKYSEAPRPAKVFVSLQTVQMDPVRSHRLLISQNPEVNVGSWKLIGLDGKPGDWRITFNVTFEIIRKLQEVGWKLHYEMSVLPVHWEPKGLPSTNTNSKSQWPQRNNQEYSSDGYNLERY